MVYKQNRMRDSYPIDKNATVPTWSLFRALKGTNVTVQLAYISNVCCPEQIATDRMLQEQHFPGKNQLQSTHATIATLIIETAPYLHEAHVSQVRRLLYLTKKISL